MSQIEIILFLAIIVILLFFLGKFWYSDFHRKQKQKKRFKRGRILETKAKTFLESKGYYILDEQKSFNHIYTVNEEQRSSALVVDYIVEKNGKKYIVEVKSGKSAISLKDKNSRRQLLEYDFVIENHGVFLLDMENKNMQRVKFQTKSEKNELVFQKVMIILAGLAIIIPSWTVKFFAILFLFALWFYPVKTRSIIMALVPIN